MQQVFRTRPPEGSQFDFVYPVTMVLGFLFIGLALWALGYTIAGAALSGWAAMSFIFILFRVRDFNRWVEMAGNPVILDTPEPVTEIRTTPLVITPTGNGANYRFNNDLHLQPEDWQRLAQFVIKKDGISRDGLIRLNLKWPENQGPKSPTEDGITYYDRWISAWGSGPNGAGYFVGEKEKKLTEKGRRFFSQYIPHPTSETANDTRPHETTVDETTIDGGER